MDQQKLKLCTICARGGSKGVKNKNIREMGGKPLIAYTLLQAKASQLFKAVAVSSDSDDILNISKKWGADILIKRPDHLAADDTPKLDAIRHAVEEAEKQLKTKFEILVDLDATSPFRSVNDIVEAVRLLESKPGSNVITAAPARKSPYFNLVELDQNGFAKLSKKIDLAVTRRQDSPKCFDMNASIYVWKRAALFGSHSVFHADTLLYVMPEERSIEIDSELDFEIANLMAGKLVTHA